MHFMPRRLHKLTDFLVAAARRLFDARRVREAKRNAPARPLAKRPARCWFERLESREVFSATFHGGALIPHVEAQAVFLGSQWNSNATLEIEADSINKYLGGLVQSPYMDMLTDAGYNVGQGTYTPGKVINTTITGTVTDATIRSLLQAAINFEIDGKPAGLVEQPDANRLYIVYTPSGVTVNDNGATSQTSFLGYHGAFAGSDVYGVPFDIHYVVVPHPGTPNPVSTTNGFIGVSDAQVLTLGGTSGGTLLPTFNGVTATTPITRTDEQQTVTIGGSTTDGSFKLGYNGVTATTAVTPVNEVQTLSFQNSTSGSVSLSFGTATAATLQKNESQKLTLGGADGSTITLSYQGTSGSALTAFKKSATIAANDVLAHLNTIPALVGNIAVNGSTGGPFTIAFQGGLASTNVDQLGIATSDTGNTVSTIVDGAALSTYTAPEIQANLNTISALTGNINVTGNSGGPFTISFGGSLANSNVTPIVATGSNGATASVSTTTDGSFNAANLQASLQTIPALAGNIAVTGTAGSSLTVTFLNALTGVNVSQLTIDSSTGAITPTIATSRQGTMPTAAQVQSSLNGIAALTNNVTVTGNDGGPFTIAIKNLTTIPLLDVTTVSGGLTASISQGTGPGSSADLDQITAVTSHELAEAVTDPNVNYKTLGWYDAVNNVEIADLPNATADIPNITVRLNGFLTQKVYDQSVNRIAPDTTSIAFNAALTGVTQSQISPTQLLVSWIPVIQGATGYRVFLEHADGSAPTLLSRVPRTATSAIVTLPLLSQGKLKVEAYNAAYTTDLVELQFTMDLPAVQKPVATAKQLMSGSAPVIGSALVTWTMPVPSGSGQVLTLGGTGAGSFTLAYDRSNPTVELNRVDEVQTLTVGGAEGGTIHLSYKGVAGTTATQLKIATGTSPTATDILNHLASIPELSMPGVLQVSGAVGGPFTITFTGGLSGVDVDEITATTSGGATASIATPTQGSAPSAVDVKNALTTAAPSLSGHLTVTGNAGGPYLIQVTNASGAFLVNVNSINGGVTAAVNGDIGATGFRIFSASGTTKKLVATLPGTATSVTIAGLKAGSKVTFIVEAFNGSAKADSTAVSAQLVAANAFTVTRKNPPPSPNVVELDWTKFAGATGYRIYRVTSSGSRLLVATRSSSATSVLLSGFPASTKFVVQAMSGSKVLKTSGPV
jgi:hypothetical protein